MQNPKSALLTIFATGALSTICGFAQSSACTGYRVVARHFDAELRKTWELRQDCAHPAWPAQSISVQNEEFLAGKVALSPGPVAENIQPLLVHAGEPVRLWSQNANARIEISGIAEQSARLGERINVRIAHQTEEAGIAVQHIAGIVRADNDVEIAQ